MPATQREVFAPAKGLVDLAGVRICKGKRHVVYHALLWDRHSVVFANGAPVESFFPGKAALEFIGNRLRYELTNALKSLGGDYGPMARPCMTSRQAQELCQVLNAQKPK
ncbi:Hint domain-containing protein [uncultured Tateyamaria sp.]|uniref:Hint domain-containing protein n=1 Tax=uncultured Tateyamaria sp. TaxID=455651 RepID=UPI00344DE5B1